jgi:hypothetical protein
VRIEKKRCSIGMVMTTLYYPAPAGMPVAFRTLLLFRASGITCISVRRALGETDSETALYVPPKLRSAKPETPCKCELSW